MWMTRLYRLAGQPSETTISLLLIFTDILRLILFLLFTEYLKPSDHFSNLECAMRTNDINYGIDGFMRYSHRILPNTCIFERNNGELVRADCIEGLRYLPGTIVPSYYVDCVITSTGFITRLRESALVFFIPVVTVQMIKRILSAMYGLAAIYRKYRVVDRGDLRDTVCLICMDEVGEVACMHECRTGFHEVCIAEWNNVNDSCPLCRR